MTPTDIEKENLEAHTELCAYRYIQLENRLNDIEIKVSKVHSVIEESHASMTKVLVGTAGTIVTGILSTLIIILTR